MKMQNVYDLPRNFILLDLLSLALRRTSSTMLSCNSIYLEQADSEALVSNRINYTSAQNNSIFMQSRALQTCFCADLFIERKSNSKI